MYTSLGLQVYGDIAFSNLSNDLGNTSIGLMNAWIAFANTLSPNADDCALIPLLFFYAQ